MKTRSRSLLSITPLLLAGAAMAQTGPWQEGEILLRAPGVNPPTQDAIWRIDPATGHGAQYLVGYTDWTKWGRMAFDPYRGGFATCMAMPGDNPNLSRMLLLRHDGSAEHLPGFDGKQLSAFAAAGDGRVFFQEVVISGPRPIRWIDAFGAAHVLMDTNGTTPLDFGVEHLWYHAPSNALIATNSPWWSTNHCASGGPSAFRIPLSADGSKVAGPILCSTWPGPIHEIMSIDALPSGKLLIVCATGGGGSDRLLELDPLTATFTAWADPWQNDLNGGLWCDLVGAAVVLDDATPDTLRTFSAGVSGPGGVLVTDVSLNNFSSGFSPVEGIWEVRKNAGASGNDGNYCTAHVNSTGKGAHMSFSGSKSLADNALTLTAQPIPAAPFLFIYSSTPAANPFGNGTLCLGGSVKRILPTGTTAGNVAQVTPDLNALGLTPGTWNFQCWFRDVPAGGAQFDLSDATRITLVP